MNRKTAFCCAATALFSLFIPKLFAANKGNELYLLVGTYTSGSSKGIYVYRFDCEKGTYRSVNEVTGISNPSYLTLSPNEKFVYAVSENEGNKALACAFSFDKKDGKLSLLNSQQTHGGSPCYIKSDATGEHVITANYSGGNISIFATAKDGYLLPASQVIDFNKNADPQVAAIESRLHCIAFSPDGKYLFADDLGKDKIHKMNVKMHTANNNNVPYLEVGSPAAFDIKKGSGPRHLTFHPNNRFAYLINELSGTITSFKYSEGILKSIQYIASDTTKEVKKGSADIHISPDGRFLYASNRLKADGIAIFSIHPTSGLLTKVGYQPTGIHPRNFIITPNGKYLLVANRDSNNIQIFSIDKKSGLLNENRKSITIDKPVCLKFASTK